MTKRYSTVLTAALATFSFSSFCMLACNDSSSTQQPGTVAAPTASPQAVPTPTPSTTATPSPTPSPSPQPSPTPNPFAFTVGTYGGNNVEFDYHSNGSVSIKFACASGTISGPITIDSFGNFNARGSYQPTAGPVPVGGFPSFTANYYGVITGNDLQLYANYTEAGGMVIAFGPFNATLGETGRYTELCTN